MITAQRRKLILAYLREHGGGSIVEIAAMLGSSRSSVRRDLITWPPWEQLRVVMEAPCWIPIR